MTLNPFHGNGVCPLKTPENLRSSDVFQGVYKKTSSMRWVKDIFNKYIGKLLTFMLAP